MSVEWSFPGRKPQRILVGLEGRVQVGRVEKVSRGYVMETSKYLLIFFYLIFNIARNHLRYMNRAGL